MPEETIRDSTMESVDLVAWYHAYTNEDGSMLTLESDVVQAVLSDDLDHADIASRVQCHVLAMELDETERLCAKCLYLMRHWPDLPYHIEWVEVVACELDTEELEAGSRCRCRFCHYLFCTISNAGLLEAYRKIEARLRKLETRQTASLSVQNWGSPWPGSQLLWINLPGKRATDSNDVMAETTCLYSDVMLPSSSSLWRGSYQNDLGLANAWLQKCRQFHVACSVGKPHDRQRPTRLISVKDGTIKLVLTAEWEMMPPYATLSYCWGTQKFTMLECDNIADFLEAIPFEEMPKTFQDAVSVTRNLGVEYIWIDALCIIQDSPDNVDWSHESNLMGSVYSQSHINIAASSAESVYDGMFTKSKLYCGGFSARVTAVNDGEVTGYSCVRSFFHHSIRQESSDCTHLATRAWALQEKLLPPRTLSIGNSGMFWECRDAIWSEFLPDGVSPFFTQPQVRAEDKQWEWDVIVSRYSRANLTYESDKLPALSGIAARQRRITNDTYLAGMWQKDLHLQLHWQVLTSTQKPRLQWRAPSWSWMSIDGPVSYPSDGDGELRAAQVLIHVLKAWTSTTEPDGCGAVLDGQISLLCSGLVDGHVTYGDGTAPDTFIIKVTHKKVHVKMNCLPSSPDGIAASRVFLLPTVRGRTGTAFGMDIEWFKRTNRPMSCACPEEPNFYYDEENGSRFFHELHVSGLVLRQINTESGLFCRIGSFSFSHETCPVREGFGTEKNQHYHYFLSALDQIGTAVAEDVCVKVSPSDELPEMQYKLTIS